MTILLLIIVPLILAIWAQSKISRTYSHWSKVPSLGRITGAEAADAVMRKAGIHDVEIVPIRGHLTDHYDPLHKRLALSEENFHGTSLAALGVAAHEAGHAIQHKKKYIPLQFRSALIPVTNFASQLLPFIILGGFFLGILGLIKAGVIIYLILTVFQLVTLPVEYDASRRAKKELMSLGILQQSEMPGVNQTLNAAALTYVAAFVASLANLLYFFMLSRRDH
ncbi:MAG: peptidase [Verrucomicrobia bacterium CG_4_10_14_3_um_filter_43_23]|nr:MAG: peptidase [Verrucomicrobia bacterium CG1_02_43_26]PIP59436.1 MAG: peptidase [Verrucomicrobia bacterium CG22_combo_CG10-13_8_21_14_all_43_17]PIX57639.1 MAG: peptidase [Verrucomicrobia bacterium CG_4_10_14_3_um_filter_43_23]PIY61424.1 MAG: peptidase [Verrucomicrobia bacterium CG_4_10_14_0_8_um_filter_43_34]PJA43788.1 MAG: peptidase [Verrucomicrobia bacterium CG_4_9_14_3_um_filter_43_20]